MKSKFFCCVLGLFLLMVTPALAQSQADWTILYYSAADNDLEGFMLGDLMEMHLVGSSDDVNLVIQIDRIPGYDDMNGGFTDTRRFYIEQAGNGLSGGDFPVVRRALLERLSALDPEQIGMTNEEFRSELRAIENASDGEIEELVASLASTPGGGAAPVNLNLTNIEIVGETETGDPAALVDFALWGIEQYPAEKYMLILSNHGGGWTGIAFDESSDNDPLTMLELESALDDIIRESGIGKFELIGFDACLMGQLEVYATIAPYARYTLAAQEVIPGAGWEYVTPLTALNQDSGMSTANLSQLIIDGYMDYYTYVMDGYSAYDLHLIDLEQVPAVLASMEQFTRAIQSNPQQNLLSIGRARNNAQVFSQNDPDSARFFSSVDLIDFMQQLSRLTDDSAVQNAAQSVISAAQSMVIYSKASAALPGANGVSVYFPANLYDYSIAGNDDKYPLQTADKVPAWIPFLETFYGTATTTFSPADLHISIDEVIPNDGTASIWDPPVVLFTLDGSGIVDLQFFAALQLPDQDYAILVDASTLSFSYTDEYGDLIESYPEGHSPNLEFAWNVEMPRMSDSAGNTEITVLTTSADNPSEATVSGIYRTSAGTETRAYLVLDVETQQVTKVYSIQEASEGQAVGELRPQVGDTFEPYYRFLDESGEIHNVGSETRFVFSNEPFSFEFIPAATGNYIFTMWVKDMAGNISQDSVAFEVNNDDLDTGYRGFKDLTMGLNFLFPWGWSNPSVTINSDDTATLSASDPEGEISIITDIYEVSSADELVEIAQDNLDAFGASIASVERADLTTYYDVTYDAYHIFYSYVSESGADRAGAQLIVYVPENGYGYILDVDTVMERAEEAEIIFNDILLSIDFFPPR